MAVTLCDECQAAPGGPGAARPPSPDLKEPR